MELCDYVREKFKETDILFIPNCMYNTDTPLEDDGYVYNWIIKRMKDSTMFVISEDVT